MDEESRREISSKSNTNIRNTDRGRLPHDNSSSMQQDEQRERGDNERDSNNR